MSADGVVLSDAVVRGHLEDITYASLAPLLRRLGIYLLHAAAARRDERAILLVGPSGSGKTTSALALMLSGWQLYANDVVALSNRQGVVLVHPTPGAVTVRRHTLALLPALRNLATPGNAGGARLPSRLIGGEGVPAAISAIYFPEVRPSGVTTSERLHRSVALARLIEESVDRWDAEVLEQHTAILTRLAEQSRPFRLLAGEEIAGLDRHLRQDGPSPRGPF